MNSNDASVDETAPDGPESIVGVSTSETIQLRVVAGDGFPAASFERTSSVWAASVRPL